MKLRFIDILFVGGVAALVLWEGVVGDGIDSIEPPPPHAMERQERRAPLIKSSPLPPENPGRDPEIVIVADEGPAQDSVGTAFSLNSDGVWLTAAHVVQACARMGLVVGERRAHWFSDVVFSPDTDLAVIRTLPDIPALQFSDTLPRIGDAGYGVGYPQGSPADVAGTLMGRAYSREQGSFIREPVLVWSETLRTPPFEGSLGGISGGPLFNERGEVVGVILSASIRRGRFNTAAPVSLFEIVEQANVPTAISARSMAASPGSISEDNLQEIGNELRRDLTVAQVVCLI